MCDECFVCVGVYIYHGQLRVFSGVDAKLKALSKGGKGGPLLVSEDGRREEDVRKQWTRMSCHQMTMGENNESCALNECKYCK